MSGSLRVEASEAWRMAPQLREAAAELGCELGTKKLLGAGIDNYVYRLRSNRFGTLVAKITRRGRSRFARAQTISEIYVQAGIKAPRVLWIGDDACIEEYLPGRTLDKAKGRAARATILEAGRTLRQIHAIEVDEHFLGSIGGGPEHKSFAERARFLSANITAIAHLPPDVTRASEALLKHSDVADIKRFTCLHGDWTPSNVIAHNGRISGVIDLQSARVGDRLSDLATWSLQASVPSSLYLFRGYQPEGFDRNQVLRILTARLLIGLSIWLRIKDGEAPASLSYLTHRLEADSSIVERRSLPRQLSPLDLILLLGRKEPR